MLTQGRLKEVLDYDPETGEFYRRVNGKRTGSTDAVGYRRVYVDGKLYYGHRLAWLYVHGSWPTNRTDHINQVRGDDRIKNLREATQAQNLANAKLPKNCVSGFKGVHYVKRKKKPWKSQIRKNGICFYLGTFETPEEAFDAYCAKAKELYGEFFCLG